MNASYVSGPSIVPLLGETIGHCLNRMADACGDREALVSCHQGLRYTYREIRAAVDRAARGLLALGVERGDRVGIWSPSTAEWMITQYAAAKVGAILVNINPAYRLRELEYVLQQSGISVLVLARRFRSADYVAMLVELAPELELTNRGPLRTARLPSLRAVVYLGDDPAPGGMAWSQLLALGETIPASTLAHRESVLQFDDPVNIQYTSGTTGAPKGATLSHHNILNNGSLRRRTAPLHAGRPRLRAGALLSLLRLRAWATWPHSRTAARSSCRPRASTRRPHSAPCRTNVARRFTACRRCSSRSSTIRPSRRTHSTRCEPASWPALRARLRS